MKYEAVIGLEIHAELETATKAFCSCLNAFGDERNTNVCPVCLGLPGALPVLNRKAVELAISAGMMLGCSISRSTRWDRKNYFYPDLTKAYQISQLYAPLCLGGGLEINSRFIRLNRIHLEEDAGKLIHEKGVTIMDYNRAGVPLIEIVTEPDLRSPDDAVEFVEKVRQTLVYGGICDGKMEQGSLRVDANISVMPEGSKIYGTRSEIKNINSFRFIKKALAHEIERQMDLVSEGGRVVQETRRYDENSGETFSMRTKEDAHDYRYFPDPDIPSLLILEEEIGRIRAGLTEAPASRFSRYTSALGLSPRDASAILSRRRTADFFDAAVSAGANPKNAANSIKGEIQRLLNESGDETQPISMPIQDFVKALALAQENKITQEGLKIALSAMYSEKIGIGEVAKKYSLYVSEDNAAIKEAVESVIASDPASVAKYKNGNEKVLSFLLGQCMKKLRGKALPQTIGEELKKALER
ncbi:MAG: Asp-tRNA(Asn)/Glu-tRNA(Gln) amidotransferase subunit GatB [Clostridiales bacterium]|jgi:aspartyl-tRNA(Asn)/glutamyl-tRNA(Gln) amidotransferase subunit B|nr:Asp-tRNA(Asn)/Glu-tRNA(Gln) amidotransferase subunit GatB [Clostridiales bacterium]